MEKYILDLLAQYPWLMWVILILFIILVIAAFLQGRQFTIAGFGFGPKEAKTPIQSQAVPPVSVINNIYPETTQKLSEEQYEEIYQRVVNRLEEHPKEKTKRMNQLFPTIEPPEETMELFQIQLTIEKKIREVVVSHGGWAGSSIAPISNLLNIALIGGIFSQELIEEISRFYGELHPGILGAPISKESLTRVQIIALDIMRQLESLGKGPYG